MKIRIADGSGFCFGVKRAMEMAHRFASDNKKTGVYSLHEIIHNPQEVKRLEEAGARHVESVAKVKKGAPVIVSTHGISAAEEDALKQKEAVIMDTTCPYVKKIHRIVSTMAKDGYQVLIIGDRDHLEVKGILGHCEGDCAVLSSEADLEGTALAQKVGIVAQTTLNTAFFRRMVDAVSGRVLASRYAEVRIFNTICDATAKRQEAVTELARQSDVMVIVGGRNSANTKRLYEISSSITPDSYLIEGPEELKKSWFKGKRSAGISAGASTPESVIRAVADKMAKMGDK